MLYKILDLGGINMMVSGYDFWIRRRTNDLFCCGEETYYNKRTIFENIGFMKPAVCIICKNPESIKFNQNRWVFQNKEGHHTFSEKLWLSICIPCYNRVKLLAQLSGAFSEH